jgi:hypothetical protein
MLWVINVSPKYSHNIIVLSEIHPLFNIASTEEPHNIEGHGKMISNSKLVRICKKAAVTYLRHYPNNCLEGKKEAIENLKQGSRSLGRAMSLGLPEYEAEMLN